MTAHLLFSYMKIKCFLTQHQSQLSLFRFAPWSCPQRTGKWWMSVGSRDDWNRVNHTDERWNLRRNRPYSRGKKSIFHQFWAGHLQREGFLESKIGYYFAHTETMAFTGNPQRLFYNFFFNMVRKRDQPHSRGTQTWGDLDTSRPKGFWFPTLLLVNPSDQCDFLSWPLSCSPYTLLLWNAEDDTGTSWEMQIGDMICKNL